MSSSLDNNTPGTGSTTPNTSSSSDKAPSTPKSEHDSEYSRDGLGSSGPGSGSEGSSSPSDEDQCEAPAIVIYLVDPFTLVQGQQQSSSEAQQRLACLWGLLRCYNTVLNAIPDSVRANISVQIVSLESILELGKAGERRKFCDDMRATALAVFSQCRRQLSHDTKAKALTGFGTAAMTDVFLKTKDEKNRAPYKVYTPPYILSKTRDKTGASGSSELSDSGPNPSGAAGLSHESGVMYVSYCLSEDQKWLLAGLTDQQGLILETATINIYIPNRTRRKKNPARRFGLQKLMDFILGVMSQSTTPWRLVVGRVGRIGHGELKGWSGLLSRKALQRASRHLREICTQCSLPGSHNLCPALLSASLVSLEPDSSLRVMPQQFTPDTRFSPASVHCPLSTPQDVSCTHILVFPTSATTQSSQNTLGDDNAGFGDGGLFGTSILDVEDPDGIVDDFYDIFANAEDGPYPRSPTGREAMDSSSQPGSPGQMGGNNVDSSGMFHCNGQMNKGLGSLDTPEEIGTLLQQPLALGYFVSTAPTGRLPRWFWSACPHLESVCPAFLKSALHMHTSLQNSEDFLQQATNTPTHPLDSTITTDVLRYVLEGYNALSWLAMDSNTHDRLSCLPIHIQALMQLYHMTCTLL
uniref:Mediator of RNA polymerase II transcription subunit 13 n=3 Tax=Cacopsylla melanoneura TaxID=428564 RepID=A0A8D8VD45_9HEMI